MTTILLIVAGFFLGASLGSFSSAVIWRIPRHIPWVYEVNSADGSKKFVRSHCPSCGQQLTNGELIPIISWFLQNGSCRHCQSKYGVIYLLLEIFWGLSGVLVFFLCGLTLFAVFSLFSLVFFGIFLWVWLFHKIFASDILFVLLILLILAFFFRDFTGF